ncbi:MAG: fold metallo-hydrolase [Rhizobacter sp.]|nr:fold metallo-hydrolase [Rhizobacter sp.]
MPSTAATPEPTLARLPDRLQVLERGWLSSNNVVIRGDDHHPGAIVDTGYATHAPQTLALVAHALGGTPLGDIVNTHLHSDHCGGNAALAAAHGASISIPAADWQAVVDWDEEVLTYAATGQQCPRYRPARALQPGQTLMLGGTPWQVHAAPGHDPHSVVLFEAETATLISADALWENGFGIVFPELDGVDAFDEVRSTLGLIERLSPKVVIPGHGSPFVDVADALARAHRRLESFEQDPRRHARYAAKALTKFHLLEVQSTRLDELCAWLAGTPILKQLHAKYFEATLLPVFCGELCAELVKAQAARIDGETIYNA